MTEDEKQEIEEEIPDDTPDSNFSKVDNGMFYLPVLEVYKNDFENYEPYVPKSGEAEKEEEDDKEEEEKQEDEEETEEDEKSTDETEEKPFDWQLGEILETYYYNGFSSIDYEQDYAEISSSASINIPTQVDLLRFWKGVQGKLFCGWFKLNEQIEMEDIPLINAIFIEDLSFKEDGTDLSLKGGDILLEEKYEFNFTQMKRSEILKEMIKTAGLEAAVDPTGLIDDVIDYTNVKSSGEGGGADSDSKDLNQLVKNAIKGKSSKRDKAEAVHNALRDSCIKYRKYYNFQYNTVKECWEHRNTDGLNCGDTSQLTVGAMKIAGLSAETLLTDDAEHYITRIEGQWFSDLVWSEGQCSQRPFDETWHNYRSGTPHKAPGN
jgi:hypothetical protein